MEGPRLSWRLGATNDEHINHKRTYHCLSYYHYILSEQFLCKETTERWIIIKKKKIINQFVKMHFHHPLSLYTWSCCRRRSWWANVAASRVVCVITSNITRLCIAWHNGTEVLSNLCLLPILSKGWMSRSWL